MAQQRTFAMQTGNTSSFLVDERQEWAVPFNWCRERVQSRTSVRQGRKAPRDFACYFKTLASSNCVSPDAIARFNALSAAVDQFVKFDLIILLEIEIVRV